MASVTHEVSLRVQVTGPEQFSEIYKTLTLMSLGMGMRFPGVTVGSISIEAGYEEDEEMLSRVRSALRESGLSYTEIDSAVDTMKNFGIIFRERAT